MHTPWGHRKGQNWRFCKQFVFLKRSHIHTRITYSLAHIRIEGIVFSLLLHPVIFLLQQSIFNWTVENKEGGFFRFCRFSFSVVLFSVVISYPITRACHSLYRLIRVVLLLFLLLLFAHKHGTNIAYMASGTSKFQEGRIL